MILKADGPAVRILWSIDCREACVTAAVRTKNKQRFTKNSEHQFKPFKLPKHIEAVFINRFPHVHNKSEHHLIYFAMTLVQYMNALHV